MPIRASIQGDTPEQASGSSKIPDSIATLPTQEVDTSSGLSLTPTPQESSTDSPLAQSLNLEKRNIDHIVQSQPLATQVQVSQVSIMEMSDMTPLHGSRYGADKAGLISKPHRLEGGFEDNLPKAASLLAGRMTSSSTS